LNTQGLSSITGQRQELEFDRGRIPNHLLTAKQIFSITHSLIKQKKLVLQGEKGKLRQTATFPFPSLFCSWKMIDWPT